LCLKNLSRSKVHELMPLIQKKILHPVQRISLFMTVPKKCYIGTHKYHIREIKRSKTQNTMKSVKMWENTISIHYRLKLFKFIFLFHSSQFNFILTRNSITTLAREYHHTINSNVVLLLYITSQIDEFSFLISNKIRYIFKSSTGLVHDRVDSIFMMLKNSTSFFLFWFCC